ncbi:MAG: DUF354 domain-containing protein [Nitrososphaeria archaeon]
MKIWFDALTPKHYLMFASLERILGKSHELVLTTREYEELNRVRARVKIKTADNVVGKYGGSSKEEKLIESTKRTAELSKIIPALKPNLAISFGSPEAARVSFGLGIPHVLICDSPHSFFVCKLTIPLSDMLLYPWVIPAGAWDKYGATKAKKYRSLDPTAWITHREMWPEKNSIERAAEGAIIIREEEYMSSYVKSNGALEFSIQISKMLPNYRIILLRRYIKVNEKLDNLMIYGGDFFGPNMLEKAAAFIGRGGTMNAEAALLGIKSFTMYPGEMTYIDNYLIKAGAIIKPSDLNELANEVLSGKKRVKIRVKDASEEIARILTVNYFKS